MAVIGTQAVIIQSESNFGSDPKTWSPEKIGGDGLAQVEGWPFHIPNLHLPNPFNAHNFDFVSGWAEQVGEKIAENCLKHKFGGGSGSGDSGTASSLTQLSEDWDIPEGMENFLNSLMQPAIDAGT